MKTEIKHNWHYSQSVEEVWEYLTKAELIAKWLMPNNFEPIVDKEFQFTSDPIPALGLDGTFYCKVLEIIPFKKLVYSWKGGLTKSEPTLDTIVEWTLEANEIGTELSLLHSGFTEGNEPIFTGMYQGWNEHIQKMMDHLTTN